MKIGEFLLQWLSQGIFARRRQTLLADRQVMSERFRVDTNAQLQHDQHTSDHYDRLEKKRRLEVFAEPELNAENIGNQQSQTNISGEAFGVLGTLDDQVLRNVRNNTTELKASIRTSERQTSHLRSSTLENTHAQCQQRYH